jgi:DNA-binding MarR family transcriptional regulator
MLEHHQKHAVELQLTLPQAQALRLLRTSMSSTSGLAGLLGISAPAVTQLTNRLVRKRLIERRTVETDRRAVLVALTEKGRRVIDSFRHRRNEAFQQALSRLDEDDRALVIGALAKVAAVLETQESLVEAQTGVERLSRRTAVTPAAASKEMGHAPMSLPTRRMKIEWD